MGRVQEFNTQDAIDKALHVFWEKGYKGTSMSDLLDEMGIGKSSLYATFGSKRELFLAALKKYGEKRALVCQASDVLAKGPARQAIANFFQRVIDRSIDDKRCCMFGKTALEFWQTDPAIADKVKDGVKQVEDAFHQTVLRGQKDGDINPSLDSEAIAQYLAATYYGLQVMASANPNPKILTNIISASLAVLN